jgi:hypothetical protein
MGLSACLRVGLFAMLAVSGAACRRDSKDACTDYFDRVSRCIAKMGPEARSAAEANLRRERNGVAAAMADPQRRAQAAAACQASSRAIADTCDRVAGTRSQ